MIGHGFLTFPVNVSFSLWLPVAERECVHVCACMCERERVRE